MKILLKKDVDKLGRAGDIVEVSPGYARNFILPQKLGVVATESEVERYRRKKEAEAKLMEEKAKVIDAAAKKLKGAEIVIKLSAGEGGEVFESAHKEDVIREILILIKDRVGGGSEKISEEDIDVDLDKDSAKTLGEHEITCHLGRGENKKEVKITLKIEKK